MTPCTKKTLSNTRLITLKKGVSVQFFVNPRHLRWIPDTISQSLITTNGGIVCPTFGDNFADLGVYGRTHHESWGIVGANLSVQLGLKPVDR